MSWQVSYSHLRRELLWSSQAGIEPSGCALKRIPLMQDIVHTTLEAAEAQTCGL